MFTEEEADLFVQLTPTLETAEDIAKRLGREMEQTAQLLNRMSQKGQLYRYKQDETEMFATMPYFPGIFESVVIDRELAVAMDEYYDTAFDRTIYPANRRLSHVTIRAIERPTRYIARDGNPTVDGIWRQR